jgi:hypothetical protein
MQTCLLCTWEKLKTQMNTGFLLPGGDDAATPADSPAGVFLA